MSFGTWFSITTMMAGRISLWRVLLPNGVGTWRRNTSECQRRAKSKLYHSNRDGTFSDVTREMHLDRILPPWATTTGIWIMMAGSISTAARGIRIFGLSPEPDVPECGGRFFQDVTTATGTGHIQKGTAWRSLTLTTMETRTCIAPSGVFAGDLAECPVHESWNHEPLAEAEAGGHAPTGPAIGATLKGWYWTPSGRRGVASRGQQWRLILGQSAPAGDRLRNAAGIAVVEIHWPGSTIRQQIAIAARHELRVPRRRPGTQVLPTHPVRLDTRKGPHHSNTVLAKP